MPAFSELYSDRGVTIHVFQLSCNAQLTGSWHVPIDKVRFIRQRVDVGAIVRKPAEWEAVEQLFLTIVREFQPFWGEIADDALTRGITCTLDGHETTVPVLAQANFFGPDYIESFGGSERIRAAGFARAVPVGEGVYVELPKAPTPDEYRTVRASVQSRLAPTEVFDPKVRGPVPRFREHDE